MILYKHVIVSNNDFYVWFGVIILRSLEKGVSWKFWLDPRFPRNPKLKWSLKWLPLDRGYFKFYFLQKGESLLIIPSHTYLSSRKFVSLFQIITALPCILFVINCPVFRYYLINNHSRRGDVETLARSSVSPPSQVKNDV